MAVNGCTGTHQFVDECRRDNVDYSSANELVDYSSANYLTTAYELVIQQRSHHFVDTGKKRKEHDLGYKCPKPNCKHALSLL